MAKREKGKIARSEWPAIIARHESGESYASIARLYGCTAPAIRYIVGRGSPAPATGMAAAGGGRDGRPGEAQGAGGTAVDRALRERVNSAIAAFLVAFDAAYVESSASSRAALLDATDRLLRAAARTRIALERMTSQATAEAAPDPASAEAATPSRQH